MFQTFDAPAAPVTGFARLDAVRAIIAREGCDALLVPHADAQRNEYLPANAERLAWLSGFTGSAGAALVTRDEAILFADGRYTIQAAQQIDGAHWSVADLAEAPPTDWLAGKSLTVAYDPWLHTASEIAALEKVATLHPLSENPIDAVWDDRPSPPRGAVSIHPFELAGQLTADKLIAMDEALAKKEADLCALSDATSVSWLFNIRGADVPHTPLVLAHAILRRTGAPLLFVDSGKLDMGVRAFLTQVAELREPSEFVALLEGEAEGKRVGLDPKQSPFTLTQIVENAGGTVVAMADPVVLPRARKNAAEIVGSREAHRRDGAAMATFLAWLDAQAPGSVDEIAAARKLEETRAAMAGNMPLRDISFDTISGSGPNGAIVHHRVTEATNRTLGAGELYLVDSGAQYGDGTTDITRTVAIGTPDAEQKRCFTLVLKGHIRLATARFPKGTRGVDLDVLARDALWRAGLDYAHGTGHGIGSYLSVHEGPQNVSKRGMVPLEPGMILSNEPGYYREGAFGIRIENLVLVTEAEDFEGGDKPMLGFETLSFTPIDRRLIDLAALEGWEIEWLDTYHARTLDMCLPGVNEATANWLRAACAPLGE